LGLPAAWARRDGEPRSGRRSSYRDRRCRSSAEQPTAVATGFGQRAARTARARQRAVRRLVSASPASSSVSPSRRYRPTPVTWKQCPPETSSATDRNSGAGSASSSEAGAPRGDGCRWPLRGERPLATTRRRATRQRSRPGGVGNAVEISWPGPAACASALRGGFDAADVIAVTPEPHRVVRVSPSASAARASSRARVVTGRFVAGFDAERMAGPGRRLAAGVFSVEPAGPAALRFRVSKPVF
jgi:hypothetical protein